VSVYCELGNVYQCIVFPNQGFKTPQQRLGAAHLELEATHVPILLVCEVGKVNGNTNKTLKRVKPVLYCVNLLDSISFEIVMCMLEVVSLALTLGVTFSTHTLQ